MKKLIKLFNLILKCKFKFKNPKQNNLILFDDVGEYVFENVLYTKNYSSLQVRLGNNICKLECCFKYDKKF